VTAEERFIITIDRVHREECGHASRSTFADSSLSRAQAREYAEAWSLPACKRCLRGDPDFTTRRAR